MPGEPIDARRILQVVWPPEETEEERAIDRRLVELISSIEHLSEDEIPEEIDAEIDRLMEASIALHTARMTPEELALFEAE